MFRLPSLPSVNVPGLSSDRKLAFRNATNGLARLSRSAIPQDDTNYWKQYWELFDSVEEVNTLITPQHIRSALQQYPDNIHTLFTVLANHFIRLIRSSTFPRPVTAAFPIRLSPWAATVADDVRAVLNCACVIARIIPLIYEDDPDCPWLWEEGEAEQMPDSVASESDAHVQFVIEDEDEDEADSAVPRTPGVSTAAPSHVKKRIPSLMSRFLSALVDSLFHVGFTLPTDAAESATERTSYLIWTSGIGSSTSPSSTPTILTNRSTLLLTLLTVLSHPLYNTPVSFRHHNADPVLTQLSSLPRKAYLAILCSLLNTALTPPPARLIGQVGRDEDLYPQRAIQALLVPLCQSQIQGQENDTPERHNVYQKAIAKLHRSQDFDYIIEGIKNALDAEAARRGLVNGVAKAVPVGRRASGPGALEIWLVLWRIVDLNKKFTLHLLASSQLPALLSHLFSTVQAHKESPPHFALLRTLCYILQTLSSYRAFALALSSPLPNNTATRGIDALVTVEYALMAGTHGQHAGLYQPLLITLANVGPYVKNLSVQSSNKLISLFQAFASPGFLLGDEGNPRCVFWMLEFFTHIIHYQFSDNANLVYALLRVHERLQALATFSLTSGRAEITRIKASREEHQRRTQTGTTPDQKTPSASAPILASATEQPSSTSSPEEEKERVRDREEILANSNDTNPNEDMKPPAMSEKARGKLPARSPSVDSGAGFGAGLTAGAETTVLGYESAGGFIATEDWVQSWVKGLPLDSILVAVAELLPKIQALRNQTPSAATAVLATSTLVGILPSAPPIVARRFQWTDRSEVWRASLLWGEVYVSSGPAQGPWGGTQVRLFGIKQAPLTRRDQAIASVTSAVGSMWNAVGAGVGRTVAMQAGGGSPRNSRDDGGMV